MSQTSKAVPDNLEVDNTYFDMDSAWEIRGKGPDKRAICRWCFIYQYRRDKDDELMSDEQGRPLIVGVAGGFAGSGLFMLERFYVIGDEPQNITHLYLESMGDVKASTRQKAFKTWNQLPESVLEIAEKANTLFLKWIDEEQWVDHDQLILKPSQWHYPDIHTQKEMMYVLTDEDNPWTLAVGQALGLTAQRTM